MKSILTGAAIGGAIGLGIDGAANKKGEHHYFRSLAIGSAIGAGGVGIFGARNTIISQAKSTPTKVMTPSAAPQAKPQVVPTQPIPATPTQPKGPSAFAVAKNKVMKTGTTIATEISSGGKNAWQKLNTNISMPSMAFPQIPKVDLGPAKQWARGKATAIQNSVGSGVSKISNSISSAGNTLKATGSSLSQQAGAALESVKGITATARQYAGRLITLKVPSVNVNLPRMPEGMSSRISTALEGGKKALPGYLKKAAFAIAVTAGSVASHGPSFNPVKPMIEHAQQTMSTSMFGSQAVEEFMSGAKRLGSQMMDDMAEAIPRALEHPKNTITKAFNGSAVKPAIESSVVGNSMGLTNYSDELARRMVINKKNDGRPFIVADPKYGTISTYDVEGKRTGVHNALFGKDQTMDGNSIASLSGTEKERELARVMSKDIEKGYDWLENNKLRRVDPGIHEYRKVALPYKSEYGDVGLQDTNIFGKSATSPGIGQAIHNTYLGNPIEKRLQRLKSDSVADNFISYGCMNVNSKDLQKVILPKMGKSVPVVMAAYDQALRQKYLGLSTNPMLLLKK